MSWQGCAWADSSFCTSWAGGTDGKAVCGSSLGVPDEQFILLADNLHSQPTDGFKSVLMQQYNTLLWLRAAGCRDEMQPVDAGYLCFFGVQDGKTLGE